MPNVIAGPAPIHGASRSNERGMSEFSGSWWAGQGMQGGGKSKGGVRSGAEFFNQKLGAGNAGSGFYRDTPVMSILADARYTLDNALVNLMYERPQAGVTMNETRQLMVFDALLAFDSAGNGAEPQRVAGIGFHAYDGVLANIGNGTHAGDARTATTKMGFSFTLRHTGHIARVLTTKSGSGAGGAIGFVNLAQHGVTVLNGAALDVTKFMRWRIEFRHATPTADASVRFYLNGVLLHNEKFTPNLDQNFANLGIPTPWRDAGAMRTYLPYIGVDLGGVVMMSLAALDIYAGPDIARL